MIAMAQHVYIHYKKAFSLNNFINEFRKHPSSRYVKLVSGYIAADDIARAILEQPKTMFGNTIAASIRFTDKMNITEKLIQFIEENCKVFPTQLLKLMATSSWCVVKTSNVQLNCGTRSRNNATGASF